MLHFFAALARLTLLLFLSQTLYAGGEPDKQFVRWLKKEMQKNQVPAVSLVVINDYKIDWVVGFGVSNVLSEQRIDDATLFQAGSISKPITAMAALRAVQDGKLDLDTDINHYLSYWKLPQNFYTEAEKVTLRYLLSHCAGVNVSGFLGYAKGEKLPDLQEVLDGATPSNSPPIRVINEPGEKFMYSGGGYTIIQSALIDAYHQPFPTIMSQLVLEPLSMTNSTFEQPLPRNLHDQIAKPYRPKYESVEGGPHTYVSEGAAGLWTTPFDLAKFTISIQESLRGDPYQILTPESAQLMIDPEIEHMGLGLYANVDKYGNFVKKGHYFMHTGQNEGYRSLLLASVRDGNGVIIMTNMSPDARLVMDGEIKDDWSFIFAIVQHIADLEEWD